MTSGLVLAVLFGALLHAGWNALIKAGKDKALDTALVHGLGSLAAIPLLLIAGWPPVVAWPYIGASVLIHIGYYVALAGAYRHGDLGLTYPLMRGSAPLLVALGSQALLGERLNPAAWLGVAGICCGVLVLGLSGRGLSAPGQDRRRAIGFALGNAAIIAVYTVVDGLGVRASGTALPYVAALFLLDGLPYLALVLWQRRQQAGGQQAALQYMAGRWRLATLGTAASLGSYGIALWAMTHAPVAMVAALRESSVLFAALIGTWLLREPFGWQRAAGTTTILVGVVLLRLA